MGVVNKVVVKGVTYDIEDKINKEELLKRLQGTSENSNAMKDPFKFIGSFNTSTIGDLRTWLDNLHGTSSTLDNRGFYRAILNDSVIEITSSPINYTTEEYIQVVRGRVSVASTTGLLTFSYEYNILERKYSATDGWSSWRVVASADKFEDLYAKATQIGSFEVESLTNGIGVNFSNIDGTQGDSFSIPAATTESAGVMSAEDKKILGKTKETENDGFFIVDKNGNVAMSVVEEGIDAVGLGETLRDNIAMIVDDATKKVASIYQTVEKGFHITDVFGNSVFSVTESGEVSYVGQGESHSQQRNSLYRQVGEIAKKVNEMAPKTEAVDSFLEIKKSGEHYSGSIEIPSSDYDRRNVILRVGLHHGAELGKSEKTNNGQSEVYNDVFFNGRCEKNFSDIRFLVDGSIVRHRLEHCGNYEVVRDNNFIITNFGIDYSIGRVFLGKRYSDDGGVTWNSLPNFSYGDVVFVDSRKMLYSISGSKVYMTPFVDGSYDGVNTVEICDVSTTSTGNYANAYPSQGSRAIVEDNNGYIYFGTNGPEWNAVIFRSINADMSPTNGIYVKEVYSQPKVYNDDGTLNYDFVDQHVHNFYYHKQTNTVYAGLDNSIRPYGPRIIKSTDNGDSWNEVRLDSVEWSMQRGRDYIPAYISPDGAYMLGGGEVNILGGNTLCKVFNDVVDNKIEEKTIKAVVNNGIGVRNIGAFDEDFLIAGLCAAGGGNSDIQLALSEDKGESWRTIYSENVPLSTKYAGVGVRYFSEPFAPEGGEKRILVLGMSATVDAPFSPLVVYRGGDHYYGEAYVYVGDIKAGETKTVNVESGYMLQMPNSIKESRVKPIYSIPLNEGFGDTVTDSLGNVLKINGEYEWDSFNTDVRFGNHLPFVKDNNGLNGIKLKENAFIDIGKIRQLDFNKGYTVAFWYKWDTDLILSDKDFIDNYYNRIGSILSADNFNIGFFRAGFLVGNFFENSRGAGCRVEHKGMYEFVCISVTDDELPQIIISRNDDYGKQTSITTAEEWNFNNLSDISLRIGGVTTAYNTNYPICIHSINIYDRVLDREEVQALYKGGIRL